MRDSKAFIITLFWKQNKWHNHGVIRHTLNVVYQTLKHKHYKMLGASLLHDIGKPLVAYQDDNDKLVGTYSFTNHEEIGYRVIRNCIFISDYTKNLVRYHYLLRDMKKSKSKGNYARYRRLVKIFNKLPSDFKKDLELFLILDDLGK